MLIVYKLQIQGLILFSLDVVIKFSSNTMNLNSNFIYRPYFHLHSVFIQSYFLNLLMRMSWFMPTQKKFAPQRIELLYPIHYCTYHSFPTDGDVCHVLTSQVLRINNLINDEKEFY